MKEMHVLGVDGGGTHTRCVIVSTLGEILAKGIGGPSNPLTVGVNNAANEISKAVQNASNLCGVDRFVRSIMGIAGTEKSSILEALRKSLKDQGFEDFYITSDSKIALAGATGCKSGVVVISGTGSIAYGEDSEGRTARAGGWGWRLGDEGSGYDIGYQALVATLRDFDGRGPKTLLRRMVEEELTLEDPSELVDRIYNDGMERDEIAAISSLVGIAAREGDNTALSILRKAGMELGLAASSVIRRLELRGNFTVGLVGGVFKIGNTIQDSLMEEVRRVAPSSIIATPQFPPEVGAALIALRSIGIELDFRVFNNIKTSQKALGVQQ